jgi:Family of unknown function (DUF6580)
MPNFSPLGAIGIFGGAYFESKWQAFFISIMATGSVIRLSIILFMQSIIRRLPGFTMDFTGFMEHIC